MAESNGLLDLMKSPAAMGLLAAGFGGLAGANRNTPINNLGRAGLAGLAGYSAADALQQKQVKLDQEAAIKAAIPTLYGQDGKFDYQRAAQIIDDPKLLKAYAELPNAGRAKVARTMTVPGADGKPMTVQYDDYGNKVGEGIQGYVAPMSPAEMDEKARGWANVWLRGQQNAILGEANLIAKGLQNEKRQLEVDKLEAEKAERERALDAKRDSATDQLAVIDKALNHPGREIVTGLSGSLDPRNYYNGNDATDFKIVIDQLQGAAFLQAFESLKGGGHITEVEGKKATDAMARLNTAQSDGEYKKALEELRGIIAQGQARLGGAPAQGGNQNNPPANLQGPQASGGYPSNWTPERVKRYEELKARQAQGVTP